MRQATTVEITPGVHLPLVGFGTYLIKDEDAASAVHKAIEIGYRHIDTAEAYNNESGVGQGIARAAAELGLNRSDIFVTTKLWPGNEAWGHPVKDASGVTAALKASISSG